MIFTVINIMIVFVSVFVIIIFEIHVFSSYCSIFANCSGKHGCPFPNRHHKFPLGTYTFALPSLPCSLPSSLLGVLGSKH